MTALVDVTRGGRKESIHSGTVAISDASGSLVASVGDTSRLVFPRSAVKALQAIPLIETGAADALGYDDAELALACASHNGEEVHVKSARVMLMKAGLEEGDLECGPQWPARMSDVAKLHQSYSKPCPLHNNCSGKHAGFLGLSKTLGAETRGYIDVDHPVQSTVRDVMTEMTGHPHRASDCGIDGCSIPTYPVPIANLARAFATFGTGEGLAADRQTACDMLYEACVNEPFMVAGTERFCTDIMQAMEGRVFVKTGAEGVFCGTIPELGVGISLKCSDGATRASEAMMAAIIEELLELSDEQAIVVGRYSNRPVPNRRDTIVGYVRARQELRDALKGAVAG